MNQLISCSRLYSQRMRRYGSEVRVKARPPFIWRRGERNGFPNSLSSLPSACQAANPESCRSADRLRREVGFALGIQLDSEAISAKTRKRGTERRIPLVFGPDCLDGPNSAGLLRKSLEVSNNQGPKAPAAFAHRRGLDDLYKVGRGAASFLAVCATLPCTLFLI